MEIRASYATPGGIVEGLLRIVIFAACSFFLFETYKDPASVLEAKDPLIGWLVVIVLLGAAVYNAIRFVSVFFQQMRYEDNELTIRSLFFKKIISRSDFKKMWLSARVPKLGNWLFWPGIWGSWRWSEFIIGLEDAKGIIFERRISRAWDKKALKAFVDQVNRDLET